MKREAFDAFRGCFRFTRNSTFVRTLPMLLGLAMPAFAPVAHAGSAGANVNVSASVDKKCTLTANGVSFGAYDPVTNNASTALTAQGSVAVKCTKGSTGITIALSQGGNYSTGRRMTDGSSNYLNYELYKPSATTPAAACSYTSPTVWNDSSEKLTPSSVTWSASTAATFNVCGSIPGGQDASVAASYTDTVVATVEF